MFNAKNGAEVRRLWDGDMSGYLDAKGKPDHSRADQALCNHIAFWTEDAGQIDRLFRQSKLDRDKWDRPDYSSRTIANALATVTTHWTGQRPDARPISRLPATCPPELAGTPDDPCQAEITRLKAENRRLNQRITDLEVEASLTRKILTNRAVPAGERSTLALAPQLVAETEPVKDGARELVYAYTGKILGVSGQTVSRAYQRYADQVPDVTLIEEKIPVQGRKVIKHYLSIADPSIRGQLSRASAMSRTARPRKPAEKVTAPAVETPTEPQVYACPDGNATHVKAYCADCGGRREDLGTFEPLIQLPIKKVADGFQIGARSNKTQREYQVATNLEAVRVDPVQTIRQEADGGSPAAPVDQCQRCTRPAGTYGLCASQRAEKRQKPAQVARFHAQNAGSTHHSGVDALKVWLNTPKVARSGAREARFHAQKAHKRSQSSHPERTEATWEGQGSGTGKESDVKRQQPRIV